MDSLKQKKARKSRLRRGIRKKIKGTAEKPRLVVFRSNKRIYAQVIDDYKASTLVSASSLDQEVREQVSEMTKTEAAKVVGQKLAERAYENDINRVVFDRNVYLYHGRIKALADGAREQGLNF